MRRGLVLGKFMPIHSGHINLIEFATTKCDEVIVWICVSNKETMTADLRFKWVKEIFKNQPKIVPILFEYDEALFPNTSESSTSVSKIWSEAIKKHLPKIDVIISSEKYGDYVAEYLEIEHIHYPLPRQISATEIRQNPYKNWGFVPEVVKPYYFRKICILGTESTGKSTLTKKLAEVFKSEYVSEAGRDIVENSNTCNAHDLMDIAQTHANLILQKSKKLDRILFIDTDINITKSYSKFLFNQELYVEEWIEEANKCDLYIYLDNDAPFIQDGTRLSEPDRNTLDGFHKTQLKRAGIDYHLIQGDWNERFEKVYQLIVERFGIVG
ncbi:AAA family ATPase [Flammeovirga aprica]|uniref:AAA family ATPase n=1 Tax=Flammeovirga aprica JL-4 TaxID=694437 RepID=A0A7X9RU27_9BACT|nr:AAA family ATPase [Flammeovirga aprica]NME68599.1 AAA family ATPase [Flammeovirga aprica JL-4]